MTWDEQTLDAFLTEPTRVLAGTTMSATPGHNPRLGSIRFDQRLNRAPAAA
jgi:hypothetical protein